MKCKEVCVRTVAVSPTLVFTFQPYNDTFSVRATALCAALAHGPLVRLKGSHCMWVEAHSMLGKGERTDGCYTTHCFALT